MIHNLSETVIVPIAGVILAFVMTLELIQIITDKNNFHEIETAVFLSGFSNRLRYPDRHQYLEYRHGCV